MSSKHTAPVGSIGFKIRKLREIRGLTQQELGVLSGFSNSSAGVRIAQFETGAKIPIPSVLKKIANALNVDTDSLYNLENCSLTSPYSVIHILYELEDYWGLHPVNVNGKLHLDFGGPVLAEGIRPYEGILDNFINDWYSRRESFQLSLVDGNADTKSLKNDYFAWKYEYPTNVCNEFTDMGEKVLELESERLIKKGKADLIKAVIALRNGASEADLKAQGIDEETIKDAMFIK